MVLLSMNNFFKTSLMILGLSIGQNSLAQTAKPENVGLREKFVTEFLDNFTKGKPFKIDKEPETIVTSDGMVRTYISVADTSDAKQSHKIVIRRQPDEESDAITITDKVFAKDKNGEDRLVTLITYDNQESLNNDDIFAIKDRGNKAIPIGNGSLICEVFSKNDSTICYLQFSRMLSAVQKTIGMKP
jgi:hypothetical protein